MAASLACGDVNILCVGEASLGAADHFTQEEVKLRRHVWLTEAIKKK